MFTISIICGCIGHINTCQIVPFQENVLNLTEVLSVLPCIGLLIFLGVKSVLGKKRLRNTAQFVATDILTQEASGGNLDPTHLPFSNFAPREGYITLLGIMVLFIVLLAAFY